MFNGDDGYMSNWMQAHTDQALIMIRYISIVENHLIYPHVYGKTEKRPVNNTTVAIELN